MFYVSGKGNTFFLKLELNVRRSLHHLVVSTVNVVIISDCTNKILYSKKENGVVILSGCFI